MRNALALDISVSQAFGPTHGTNGSLPGKLTGRRLQRTNLRERRLPSTCPASQLRSCQSKGMDAPEERPYRVSLACDGVPSAKAKQAAIDIAEEFTDRPWQEKVECRWTGTSLILVAENDFDSDGRA